MPVYEYVALNTAGRKLKGIIDADNPAIARRRLRESGVYPVEIKSASGQQRQSAGRSISLAGLFRRVRAAELAATTRQLSILLGAGIPLVAALDALMAQADNPALKRRLAQVKDSVNEGGSLAYALAQHPKVFSPVYISMVRAGESSGSLDLVLERLAELGEHQQALHGRVTASMAYPIFMFFVGACILFFLLTFIVPDMVEIFREMHQALPSPTLLLIGCSNFLLDFWWLLLLGFGAGIVLLGRLKQTAKGKRLRDAAKLRMPVTGKISAKLAVSRFSRTLGSLLQGGVPLLAALRIVRNILNNVLIEEIVDQAILEIEAGKSLAEPLRQSRWFSPMAVQMIAVGEQSGALESMLHKVAEVHENEAESQIMALTALLEPIMILLMGLAVGFIVVSILLPLFEMNQMIR